MCGVPLPGDAVECPGCGVALVSCTNQACGCLLPQEAAFCPYCRTAIQEAPRIDEAAAPAVEDQDLQGDLERGTVQEAAHCDERAMDPVRMLDAMGDEPSQYVPKVAAVEGELDDAMRLRFEGVSASLPSVLASPSAAIVDGLQGLTSPGVHGEMGQGGAPVLLECEPSPRLQKGRHGLLRLRLTNRHLPLPVRVRIAAEAGLFEAPRDIVASIDPLQVCETQPLRFIPHTAGADVLRLLVELTDGRRVPIGRYQGSCVLRVDDPEDARGRGHIEAGGDVIIMGNAPGQPGLLGLPPDESLSEIGERWQLVHLQEDVPFNRRLKLTAPHDQAEPPVAPLDACGDVCEFDAVAHLRPPDESPRTALVSHARICGLGRGGVPTVRWLLRPYSPDPYQEGRISRCHGLICIENGRAWIEDQSTNGIWVNEDRLERGKRNVLADGDEIHLANVVRFQVRLRGQKGEVHAVWLVRQDPGLHNLAYLFVSGAIPTDLAPCASPRRALWFFWGRDRSGQLALWNADNGGPWAKLDAGKSMGLRDGSSMCWWPVTAPLDLLEFAKNNLAL